jgi:hypothetical protein
MDPIINKQSFLTQLSICLYISKQFLFYVVRSEYLHIMQITFVIQRINWTMDCSRLHIYLAQNSLFITVKESRNRPDVAQRVPGGLYSQISWHSACEVGEVVSLTHRPSLPPGMFLLLIFTRGWIDTRAMVKSEGNMSLKNPVIPLGIDPGTLRLVA